MRILFVSLLILAGAVAAEAQFPWPDERPDSREQSVLNEDGGRAFTVLPASGPLVGLLKPDASQAIDIQQCSIFLGPGWVNPTLHATEDRLGKLLSRIQEHAQPDDIAGAGMINAYAPTWTVEKLDITGNRNIGDLEIQTIIREILKNSATPNGDSLIIVYLDPTLQSTLGGLQAGKHYLSYHAYLNTSGKRIHYAVAPYQADAQAAYQTALRTLIVAALHDHN